MEKFYSKGILKREKTEGEKEKLAELARQEARRMYDRFMEKKAEAMEREHRTISEKEVRGQMSDGDLYGTPLSPDEKKDLDKKEK